MKHLPTPLLAVIAGALALLLALVGRALVSDPQVAPTAGPAPSAAPAVTPSPIRATESIVEEAGTSTPNTPRDAERVQHDAFATARTSRAEGPVGIILTGVVRDEAGTAIEGASLQVSPDADDAGYTQVRSAVQRDSDGFAVAGLRPGAWKIVAGASGYQHETRQLELTLQRPREHVEFTLAKVAVATLTVVDESGKAYVPSHADLGLPENEDAWPRWPQVFVVREMPGTRLGHDDLSLSQFARFEAEEALAPAWGRLHSRSKLPLLVSIVVGDHALVTKEWAVGVTQFTLELPRSALRDAVIRPTVEVADARSGQPLAGIRVSASDSYDAPELLTDGSGRVQLAPRARQALTVTAYDEGRGSGRRTVDLQPGDPELIRIPLHAPRQIKGTLLDVHGKPLVGAVVRSRPLDEVEAAATGLAPDRMGGAQGGVFQINASARPHLIWFNVWPSEFHPGGTVSVVVDPTEASIDDLEVRMPASQILEVKKPGPRRLILRGADGVPISWWEEFGVANRIPVPEGTWTLETWRGRTRLGTQTIRIPRADPTPLELP